MKNLLKLFIITMIAALFFACSLEEDALNMEAKKANAQLSFMKTDPENNQESSSPDTTEEESEKDKVSPAANENHDIINLLNDYDNINMDNLDSEIWEEYIKAYNEAKDSVLEGIQDIEILNGVKIKVQIPLLELNDKGNMNLTIQNPNYKTTSKLLVQLLPLYGDTITLYYKSCDKEEITINAEDLPAGYFLMVVKLLDENNDVLAISKEDMVVLDQFDVSKTVRFEKFDDSTDDSTDNDDTNDDTNDDSDSSDDTNGDDQNNNDDNHGDSTATTLKVKITGLKSVIYDNEELQLSLPEDSGADENQSFWYLDGKKIKTGTSCTLKNLKAGYHIITVQAKSKDGKNSGAVSLSFLVKSA